MRILSISNEKIGFCGTIKINAQGAIVSKQKTASKKPITSFVIDTSIDKADFSRHQVRSVFVKNNEQVLTFRN